MTSRRCCSVSVSSSKRPEPEAGSFVGFLADGCTEIARLTGDPATADLAAAADHCAQAWTETARAGTQRGLDVRTRAAAVAVSAAKLPALELILVESLESASRSLAATTT